MIEFKKGDTITLTNGAVAKIINELGRGGQGIVYLVDVGGQHMALKWYMTPMPKRFYNNLEDNILKGAPSDVFLWPEYITTKQNGSFGYIMKIRPQGYHEFGRYLLAKAKFKSFGAMVNAAMKICEGFKALHLSGLSYQDLNDGNFFIHPETGDVLICDNDNIFPDGENSGILGKARYMAPEVVTGKSMPNKYTDRFSLSVILFLLFYSNHPFEGSRVLACPCMTERYEKQFYGSEPIFIYDKDNDTNRPVRGVHNNVLRRWMVLPEILRETFTFEFSKECLYNPSKRKLERQWQSVIQKVRDMLVVCPECGEDTFVNDDSNSKCMCCGRSFTISGALKINDRKILLTPKTKVYINLDNTSDIQAVYLPDGVFTVQLRNTTKDCWTVETPSGKLKSVDPNSTMPLKTGLKINFNATIKGELI